VTIVNEASTINVIDDASLALASIINYDHNDSGQYYKTTITKVIDDPSLS